MRLFKLMSTTFDNFDDTIKNFLSKTFNNLGLQYSHSQVFGTIFDGIKGVIENAMFYIEDALNEQNVYTASRKKSIYSLAKVSGFNAYYGSAAQGTLVASTSINNGLSSKATKIYINNYANVMNRNTGVTYSLSLSTDYLMFDISKPLSTVEIKIIQGTRISGNYTAKGNALETINIATNGLYDTEYITVSVDGKKWTRVYNLYDMTEDGEQYIANIGYDSELEIMFGNGIYGKKLDEGQTVTVEYMSHSGTLGNILPNTTTDFIFSDYGFDSLGNQVNPNDYIKLKMKNCVSGGTNADSISFIKNMIGYNSRSMVLASAENFELFFKRFSFIGHVNCWTEQNTMVMTASCLKNITDKVNSDIEEYYNLESDDILLDDDEKEMITNTLSNSNNTFAGITLKFEDPIIRRFAFICYVKVDDIYNRDLAKQNIRESLAKYFMNLPNDTTFIPKSDFITTILDNSTVIKSVDIDIISELGEQTFRDGYYNYYKLQLINGNYEYISRKVLYEEDSYPGIDSFGNISLSSKLEMPFLNGGFNYYPNKTDGDTSTKIRIEPVQVYFI